MAQRCAWPCMRTDRAPGCSFPVHHSPLLPVTALPVLLLPGGGLRSSASTSFGLCKMLVTRAQQPAPFPLATQSPGCWWHFAATYPHCLRSIVSLVIINFLIKLLVIGVIPHRQTDVLRVKRSMQSIQPDVCFGGAVLDFSLKLTSEFMSVNCSIIMTYT